MRIRNSAVRASALATALLIGTLAACATPTSDLSPDQSARASPSTAGASTAVSASLQALEEKHDARIGVSAIDTGSGQTISYREGERFGYASTLKAFIAAGFLSIVPENEWMTVATWTQDDIDEAGYSPVTAEHIEEGLTYLQLAEAAVRQSDNTAANLVLLKLGGPSALQTSLQEAGDVSTSVVSYEPDLNIVRPDSVENTTTPAAFTESLQTLLFGASLEPPHRNLLIKWMSGNSTGDALIRAAAPEGWKVADKSGGSGGTRNDIAIVTPPGREPLVITVMTTKNSPDEAYSDTTVAEAAEVVLTALK
jgi:beta-lactamase class A